MMDLDDFKLFNDTYGHPIGDQVLRDVSAQLAANLRTVDTLGRYGGDEFIAILPNTSAAGAVELAGRLRDTLLQHPYPGEEAAVPIRLSYGIATYPDEARKSNELIAFADANLYQSKRRGGDTVTVGGSTEAGEWRGVGIFGVLDGLVTAVNHKDRYTREHSEDVTDLALTLARAEGLSEESLRALRIAGLLHDVGKIGVPDGILRKPGPLTEAEFEVVKQHATLSELIIKEVPNLPEVLKAVGAHHERYDGAGYPRGLRGEEIPLLGRILAIADAYSAMTTHRPYRKARNPQEAREELLLGAGSQFDPQLVAQFLSVLQRDELRARATA
jgi:diguanylate cyclase (GGDEF)-like protein